MTNMSAVVVFVLVIGQYSSIGLIQEDLLTIGIVAVPTWLISWGYHAWAYSKGLMPRTPAMIGASLSTVVFLLTTLLPVMPNLVFFLVYFAGLLLGYAGIIYVERLLRRYN